MRSIVLTLVSLPAFGADLFEDKVRPLFVARCHACHNASQKAGGLDLTSEAGFRAVPGIGSRMLSAVGYQGRIKMPPAGKLTATEMSGLSLWLRAGARWPKVGTGGGKLWSFDPVKAPEPPAVRAQGWARSPVDRFVLARMEAQRIGPPAMADKLTLLRRATFDLTGLPPTPEEIKTFLADTSAEAFSRVVDRLLASPRYGEKWGRHWLDVARYADSTGADEDHRYPYAWRYRDYVIDAFNRDLPFDQFVREQIAGDLLPAETGAGVNGRGIVATGFLALGPKLIAEQDKTKVLYDIIDEQIDVTGRAFLGLTLGCARCHDHKFDPISTKDYYSLAAIFASTKQVAKLEGTVSQLYFAPLVPPGEMQPWEEHQKKIDAKQKEIDGKVGAAASAYREKHAGKIAGYMLAAHAVYAGGAKAPDAAAGAGLEPRLVEQWAKYLKPAEERRAYLERFYDAKTDAARQEAARWYQQDYFSTQQTRKDAREHWKQAAAAAKAKGEKEPEMPRFLAGDNRFFTDVAAAKGPFALPEGEPDVTALRAELDALKKSGPAEPPRACAVAEGETVEQRVFVRGNHASRGDVVNKRFPLVLAGESQPAIEKGSGRMELAGWIASANNPLTARVMANRIWQGHFGEGLVRTPNNFGKLGEAPTHPELLDYLAAEFVGRRWSVKAMHRLIMNSAVYQMSGKPAEGAAEVDTDNRLLSRFPRRRLAVEEMRDALLAIDGTLDLTVGGTMQSGQGTDKEFSDDRKSIDPDQSKRRLVYLPLRRSNLPSLLNLFDFGDATTPGEGRTQTNVAPQALYMMNSPFVDARAAGLARLVLDDADRDDTARVRLAFLRVLNRPPSPYQAGQMLDYIARYPGGDRKAAWTSFVRTLMASNEFLYVH